MMFEVWVSVALLGLWSCVGVIYNHSRKASRQLDEVVRLLAVIAAKKWELGYAPLTILSPREVSSHENS